MLLREIKKMIMGLAIRVSTREILVKLLKEIFPADYEQMT